MKLRGYLSLLEATEMPDEDWNAVQNMFNLVTLEPFSTQIQVKGNNYTMNWRKLHLDNLVCLLISGFCDSTTLSPISYLDCYLLTHVLPLKK